MSLFDVLQARSSVQDTTTGQVSTSDLPKTKASDMPIILLDNPVCNCGGMGFHEHSATPQPDATTQAASVNNELEFGPTDGLQLKFAKLLLKLSSSCKAQAADYMKQIEEVQGKQKEVSKMIAEAREQMNKCGDSKTAAYPMYGELSEYFAKEKLKLGTPKDSSSPSYYTKEQWEFNLKSLTNHQEQLGTKTQSLMVILQDFVGQYNANLTGAKTAITDFTDTLKTLMR